MSLLERQGTFWFVAGLIALLFATTNLPWQLDDYDQAKQAFTSFEMVHEGHWLFQHTPNEKIATKPPLIGWIAAATFALTRSWEIAWRLPSIAAAVALLVALTRAASRAYGTVAGLVSLGAGGLNLLSPRLATLVRTDMPLALVIFLLGLTIWRKVRGAQSWSARDRWIMCGLLTAAMLIKGPIVYAFLLPGIIAFQFWRRARPDVGSAWCGWWPWIVSLGVFLLWVAAGFAWVPGFYEQVVLREFLGRFGETVHRPQPIYFYLPHLLHKFAPWSLLMLALSVVGLRAEGEPLRVRFRRISPGVVWLLFWSLGGLILMSLIPSKRVDRIFPVVPPLCLLLAAQIAGLTKDAITAARVRSWSAIALFLACLFAGGYAAEKIISGYRADDAALVRFGAEVRRDTAAHGWRYEVVGGREEGLLLYLRKTGFVRPNEAIEHWHAGTIGALVVPAEESGEILKALPSARVAETSVAIQINGQSRQYLLLAKTTP